jgi:hypothetical protein
VCRAKPWNLDQSRTPTVSMAERICPLAIPTGGSRPVGQGNPCLLNDVRVAEDHLFPTPHPEAD